MPTKKKKAKTSNVERLKQYQRSPIPFIQDMWGLHPLKEGEVFKKGKHISPQQQELLNAVEFALAGMEPARISAASGHGTGKSTTLSWLILWYLFSFFDSQIACTAPTSAQMHDVLWKEIAIWIDRMPDAIKSVYEHTNSHVRIKQKAESWFARARTASKENPEALAGVHGEHVMIIVDEASGVPQQIFQTAEGALTGENVLVVMCSNPTRTVGYFYDSHHSDKEYWQCLSFDSSKSPLVENDYCERFERKYGRDSDEYRVRVMGQFPDSDAVDEKGYAPMLSEHDLKYTSIDKFTGVKRLGVDPAGEGKDKSRWVLRDNFKAKLVATESKSDSKSVAQKTLTIMEIENIDPQDVYVDSFGVGADVIQELAIAGKRVNGVNVGDKAEDDERFLNLRAEAYYRLKEWLRKGGELYRRLKEWRELLTIRVRPNLRGKVQIMPKDIMRKEGYPSPDVADALMLTFTEDDYHGGSNIVQQVVDTVFDQHSPL